MALQDNISQAADRILQQYPSTKAARDKVRTDVRTADYSSAGIRNAYMGEYFLQRACETGDVLTKMLIFEVRFAAMLPESNL